MFLRVAPFWFPCFFFSRFGFPLLPIFSACLYRNWLFWAYQLQRASLYFGCLDALFFCAFDGIRKRVRSLHSRLVFKEQTETTWSRLRAMKHVVPCIAYRRRVKTVCSTSAFVHGGRGPGSRHFTPIHWLPDLLWSKLNRRSHCEGCCSVLTLNRKDFCTFICRLKIVDHVLLGPAPLSQQIWCIPHVDLGLRNDFGGG